MAIDALVRPEIRNLQPYLSARQESATVRMNANELPWPTQDDNASHSLNRYPEIRPEGLHCALAGYYGVPTECLLATRGSSEAIDLLVRAFCRPGRDSILITPPTFAMYRVYADIQGAETLSAPLTSDKGFELDVRATLDACQSHTKLVFICTPNNPTGNVVPPERIIDIARARHDRSIIVVDEAYAEFSEGQSMAASITDSENIVVLRTLSKALALAGARCGAVMGPVRLIGWLNAMLAPYALATPVIDSVLRALEVENLRTSREAVAYVVREREWLCERLATLPQVERVWPSQTNFLLVRFNEADRILDHLHARRILVRHFPHDPALKGCVRITVGTQEENELLMTALASFRKET